MIKLMNKIMNVLILFKTKFVYGFYFKSIGYHTMIWKPNLLRNTRNVSIGCNTSIRSGVRLEVVLDLNKNATITIGNNVNIEQKVHIVSGNKVTIGNDVSITANCALVDITHPYSNIHDESKIGSRLDCSQTLEIGDGSFIGIGSVILPGANIGRYCVIGANSVVTKPIPDYCIAAGNPAKIIKRYDFEKKKWTKV